MNGSAAQCEEGAEQGRYRATGTDGAAAFESGVLFESVAGEANAAALKRLAAQRLAEHRRRRAAAAATEAQHEALARATAEAKLRENSHGTSRVRDAVAARYRQSVSYREYLAAEAERALEQAQAEAEVAARKAQAVAAAQMQLLAEIGQWSETEAHAPSPRQSIVEVPGSKAPGIVEMNAQELTQGLSGISNLSSRISAGLKVRLHEHLHENPGAPAAARAHAPGNSIAYAGETVEIDEFDELDQLDQEIEFRRAPGFAGHALETQPIQGNIIEFPRQLVAPRKARPRLAEGPLREDAPVEPQLRIFEVEPEQISAEPEVVEAGGAPEWQGLLLDAAAPGSHAIDGELDVRLRPQTAPLSQRLMSLAVDGCCIGCALVGFAAVIAQIDGPALRSLALPTLGGAAAATLLIFAVLYQMLFFTLAEATPGMRYARVGLCTFNDENPTRKALRRRILAELLAVCPLGLGLVWMVLDDDQLGWHDRISRMYPRAY